MKTYQIKLENQNYSQYHIIACVNKKLCAILIDTGACNSHISSNLVEEVYDSGKEISYTTFQGETVHNTKLTLIDVIFSKELIVKIELSVDSRKSIEPKVLLGIDFLENFEYQITRKELILDGIAIPRINMYYKDIESAISYD